MFVQFLWLKYNVENKIVGGYRNVSIYQFNSCKINSSFPRGHLEPPFFMTHFCSSTVIYWHPSSPCLVDDENEDVELVAEKDSEFQTLIRQYSNLDIL